MDKVVGLTTPYAGPTGGPGVSAFIDEGCRLDHPAEAPHPEPAPISGQKRKPDARDRGRCGRGRFGLIVIVDST